MKLYCKNKDNITNTIHVCPENEKTKFANVND